MYAGEWEGARGAQETLRGPCTDETGRRGGQVAAQCSDDAYKMLTREFSHVAHRTCASPAMRQSSHGPGPACHVPSRFIPRDKYHQRSVIACLADAVVVLYLVVWRRKLRDTGVAGGVARGGGGKCSLRARVPSNSAQSVGFRFCCYAYYA